jgi:hypothetical protein
LGIAVHRQNAHAGARPMLRTQHSTAALVLALHGVVAVEDRPLESQKVLALMHALACRISSAQLPVAVLMLSCTARQFAMSVCVGRGSLGQRCAQGSGAHATSDADDSNRDNNTFAMDFMIDER